MRRLVPLAVLFLLALPAIWPNLQPDIARTNDHLPHFYRLVELDRLLRQGVLYPRWGTDLVHGYGYPVFNFFPSLFHYVAELIHLAGLNLLAAYKTAAAATLVFSAWSAFWLGRAWFGERAGLVAGVAYLYSPYLLYDAHVRGSPPENLALAILPLVLLGIWRAAHGSGRAVFWTGLAFAAFLLAHQGVALQAAPFVAASGLLGVVMGHASTPTQPDSKSESASIRVHPCPLVLVFLTLTLGAALSAFFWLPAILESPFAQIARGTGNAGMSYELNFLSPAQMLALPRLPVDPALMNPPVARSLPHAGLLLAALALPALARRTSIHRGLVVALGLAGLLGAALISPWARPLWDAVPLLRLTLFPWRLLGPVSLFVALLAGAAAAYWIDRLPRSASLLASLLPALPIALLTIGGLPWTYPPYEPVPASPTLADLARFEIPPHFIGTTTVGEYLPRWVEQLPDTSGLHGEMLAGRDPDRLDPASLPDGATAQRLDRTPTSARYRIESPRDFQLVYRTFYFPGWRTQVDSQSLPLSITRPHGLISLPVPAGQHEVRIYFGSTGPRLLGGAVSLAALLLGIGWMGWWPATASRAGRAAGRPSTSVDGGDSVPEGERPADVARAPTLVGGQPPRMTTRDWGWAFALGLGLLALKFQAVDRGLTPLLRYSLDGDSLAGVAHPAGEDFDGELRLLGWEASAERLRADETVEVSLYWKAMRPLGIPYGMKVELLDARGRRWSQPETPRPPDWRFVPGTDFWPADEYVLDAYLLTPIEGAPPADYSLAVTVFRRTDLGPLRTAVVGSLTITAPGQSPPAPPAAEFGRVLLRDAALDRAEAVPGDPLGVQLLWGVSRGVARDATARLTVTDASGRVRHADFFTLVEFFPTSRWQPGEVLRDQLTFILPARLETGNYSVSIEVGLPDETTRPAPYALGSVRVTAPERIYVPPQITTGLLEARLSSAVELFGARFSRTAAAGAPFDVTLVWQVREELLGSLRTFVHVQNAAGTLVAQSDGIPAGWTRPTTGWLPGEFVPDRHAVDLPADLPPGDYTLFAGMYDPNTAERLQPEAFPDGRVPIGTITVAP